MKRMVKRIGLILAGLLLALGLAAGLGYAVLQSDSGRTWAARAIERALSTPGEREVRLGALSGRLPFAATLRDLTVGDPAGVWLAVDEIAYEIDVAALFDSTLQFRSLEAGRVALDRLPESAAADESEAGALAWPNLPVALRIERFALGEIALAPAVLGAAAFFTAAGEATTSQDGAEAEAALRLERTDGEAGHAEAKLRYVIAPRHLEIDARVQEPAGGLIVRALGLAELPALEARLAGQGPLSAWAGRLDLTLAGLARAEAELRFGGAEQTAFAATGKIETTADFETLPWRLASGGLAFDAEGRWQAPSSLTLDHGRVTSAAAELMLSGSLDLADETLDLSAAAQVLDRSILAPLWPTAEIGDLRLTADITGRFAAPEIAATAQAATFAADGLAAETVAAEIASEGPLTAPRLSLDMTLGRAQTADLAAENLAATAAFAPPPDFDWERPRGRLSAHGTLEALQVTDLEEAAEAIGHRLSWRLEGEVDPAAEEVRDAAVSLESERGRLTGTGTFGWTDGATASTWQLEYPALAALGPLLDLGPDGGPPALDGRLAATATVTSPDATGAPGTLEADVTGTIAGLALADPVVQSLAAPKLEFRGRVARDAAGARSIADLRLDSPSTVATGDLDVGPDFERLSATYRVEIADIAVLSAALGQPLAGSAVVTGRAAGPFNALEIAGDLEVPRGSVATLPFEAMQVAFTAREVPSRPAGTLAASLGTAIGKVTARTAYVIEPDTLDLSDLAVAANGFEADGSARVPLNGDPLTLGMDGRTQTLSPWLALAGLEGTGAATVRLDLSPDGQRQAGRLTAHLRDAGLAVEPDKRLTLEALSAEVVAADLLGATSGTLRFSAKGLALDDLALTTLEGEAAGDLAGADFDLTAAGDWYGELRLDAAGRAQHDGTRTEVEVARLSGQAFGENLVLAKTARFARDGAALEISGLDLRYGDAHLTADAWRASDGLSADVALEDLPLAALRPLVDLPLAGGRGDAKLRVTGPATAPRGEWTVAVRGARLTALSEVPPLDLDLEGDWQDGVLRSSGRLSGLSEEDVTVSLELPLRFDPETLDLTLAPDGPLAGAVDWQGPVAPLWDLVPAERHELSGDGQVHATLAGTPAAKQLGGTFALREGRYESLDAGTLLSGLTLEGTLAENRIQLTRLSAQDGASGSLEARGVIVLDGEREVSGDVSATFERFAVLRRDDITAIAKGELEISGSGKRSRLEGRIETDTVEVHIPDRLPPDVVELAVVEEGAPSETASNETAAAVGDHRMSLDVTIDIPRRAFIRGRGIDSEWEGQLKMAGTADNPAIKGRLTLVRGQVTALGKTFKLDEGRVTFRGTASFDPDLYIVARRDADDLDVTITVSGRLNNPRLAFTSVPELPEDEVISRVLFGKTTSQLSAVEAAQLAASVAELTGRGGGVSGILGRIRTTLGVDVLRLEPGKTAEDTPDVAAGKYLTDDIYIGAKQGADPESGAAEVEVELTPNISVESEVGQQGQSEVGIKFKWDY